MIEAARKIARAELASRYESEQCHCGNEKDEQSAFCRPCFYLLPRGARKPFKWLYRRGKVTLAQRPIRALAVGRKYRTVYEQCRELLAARARGERLTRPDEEAEENN